MSLALQTHCSLSPPSHAPGVSVVDRSGKLKAGDVIVGVDGLNVTDETVADAVAGCDVPGNAASDMQQGLCAGQCRRLCVCSDIGREEAST
jgi:hypothetical protein